jgi:hypothetical protein
MRLRKRAAFAMAFAGISAMAGPAMTRATDSASPLTMKPLQGVSFDIGTKRAVSYFLSDGDTCKLTLMLAEVVYGDEPSIGRSSALTSPFRRGSIGVPPGVSYPPIPPSAGLHGLARLLTLRPMDNVMNIDRHCTTWT